MDYDVIAAHFLTPSDSGYPNPEVPQSPARRLRDAIEAIATIGWWSREASAGFVGLGHGFFDGYVWGRAAALGGDVTPAVVVSAFGAFDAALLSPVYLQGRSISSRDAILSARSSGASEGLCNATRDVDLELVVSLGDALLGATLELDPGSRPFFAALQSLPVPTDPHGRLWRGAELVREHRGDGHLAACAVRALGTAEMNILTEVWLGFPVGEYSGTRGFSSEQLDRACASLEQRGWLGADRLLTDAGRAARIEIEEQTDASQATLVQALGSRLDEVVRGATLVSASILTHRAAPADPRKRYAG